jgi:hypothetical protein
MVQCDVETPLVKDFLNYKINDQIKCESDVISGNRGIKCFCRKLFM